MSEHCDIEHMKNNRNIVLIGLSGCGKTALGRQAAERFRMPFIDVDESVEARAGMPVREIFKLYGEPYFRDLESAMIQEIAPGGGMVIATGGGAVLREENMRALRENGLIVFLDRPPENIAKDIDCGARPLLAGGTDALFRMAEERRPLYLKNADVVLPCAGSPQEALEALAAVIRDERPGRGFAVIGDPIAHTLSPLIHRTVLDALEVHEPYDAIHVPKGKVGGFVEKARASGLKGFNVTIPHKKDILPFLDEVEEEAALCGAVNTVVARNGKLCGHNTDMQGLLAALQADGAGFRDKRVVILGTGGAAGAIALKAAREKAYSITVLGRRAHKAEEIGESVKKLLNIPIQAGILDPETALKAAAEADILINATPLGMSGYGEDFSSLDFLERMPPDSLVCDIVYNPPKTRLLDKAASLGLKTQNGLAMLIYQALLAEELFLGRKLDKPALYIKVSDTLSLK